MDLNKLSNEFEKIVSASCESTSVQERVILTKRAIVKYYKTEHELLKKDNDQIDEQMCKDGKQIEEAEKKIQEVKEIKDQLISVLSTISTAMIHLLARKNDVQEDVSKWENKIDKTARIMENLVKEETAKREEGNDVYKQVVKKRNNITALQIELAVLEKRVEAQRRQIKQQKEINYMLFHNEIVDFVKSVTTHNRLIQLNKDITEMKMNLNVLSVKFNQMSLNKLSTFKVRSVFATNFQQAALNNRGSALKSIDRSKAIKGHENISKVEKCETKVISKQNNKTTSSTSKIQQPKTTLSSTDRDIDRKEFQQRSDERKRKYLHLMSTSFDDLAKNFQENPETTTKETPKTNVEKENSHKGSTKKLEKKPDKEESFKTSSQKSSKKIKMIDNVQLPQSSPIEGQFLIPKSIGGRKPKKVSFAERKSQEEQPLTDDTNHNNTNSTISGNESNQNLSFTYPNTDERETSKFFKKPEDDRMIWQEEDTYDVNNEINYSFLASQYNTTKTPTDNTDDSIAQDNFFLTPNDNENMIGFDFGMGNQQSSNNPFSLF